MDPSQPITAKRPRLPPLFKGLAQLELGDAVAAIGSLKSAVRYERAGDSSSGAGAALLADTTLIAAGAPGEGERVLEDASVNLPPLHRRLDGPLEPHIERDRPGEAYSAVYREQSNA